MPSTHIDSQRPRFENYDFGKFLENSVFKIFLQPDDTAARLTHQRIRYTGPTSRKKRTERYINNTQVKMDGA
jgi:hypothetical protein